MIFRKNNEVANEQQGQQSSDGARKRKLNKWFDVRTWIDADNIKRSCATLESMFVTLKSLILGGGSMGVGERFTSFDQMVQQLGLDEQALNDRMRWLSITSWIYLIMTCLTFIYVIYLWMDGGWFLGLLSLSFIAFLGAMTCRERMRYYQLKNRLINCTLNQWWNDFCHGRG